MNFPFLGWRTLYIDSNGNPATVETEWVASCFILLWVVIYVGEVKHVSEIDP